MSIKKFHPDYNEQGKHEEEKFLKEAGLKGKSEEKIGNVCHLCGNERYTNYKLANHMITGHGGCDPEYVRSYQCEQDNSHMQEM